MARIPIRIDNITPGKDLDAFADACAESVHRAGAEHESVEVRLCPVCKTRLPADANPRRIYCSSRCRNKR